MIAMARGDVRTICTRGILRVAFSVALLGGMGTAVVADEGAPAPAPAAAKEEPKADAIKKEVQGPAISTPREIFQMLEQRKRALDKREAALRGSEMHLLELKAELEQIVTRHEQAVEAEKSVVRQPRTRRRVKRRSPSRRPNREGRPTSIRPSLRKSTKRCLLRKPPPVWSVCRIGRRSKCYA